MANWHRTTFPIQSFKTKPFCRCPAAYTLNEAADPWPILATYGEVPELGAPDRARWPTSEQEVMHFIH